MGSPIGRRRERGKETLAQGKENKRGEKVVDVRQALAEAKVDGCCSAICTFEGLLSGRTTGQSAHFSLRYHLHTFYGVPHVGVPNG